MQCLYKQGNIQCSRVAKTDWTRCARHYSSGVDRKAYQKMIATKGTILNTDKPSGAVRGGLMELQQMLRDIAANAANPNLTMPGTMLNQIDDSVELTERLTIEYTEKRDWMEARIKELETENDKLGQIASEYWLLNTKRKLQQGLPISPLTDNKFMRA